jgi:hypothetical protein
MAATVRQWNFSATAKESNPSVTERDALVLALVEEGKGEFFLIVGAGDHRAERWKLTPSLLRKLSIESFNLAIKLP